MKEHMRMRIQNLGSMVQSILQNDPAGLGSEQLMQKCDHLSSATSATTEVESFETDDDGSPISVREVLSVSVASCSSSDGSGQCSGTGGGRQNGLPSIPITSAPIAGSSRGTAAKSPPASPPRRKSRNHLRSYQATHMDRGSGSVGGASNSRHDGLLLLSLQQQRQSTQKDLNLSPPITTISSAIADVPKTKLSRSSTSPTSEPKVASSLVPTTKLARSSSNSDEHVASSQVGSETRSVRWSSTASVRTIDPVDTASRTSADDSSIPSTSNSSALGSTQSRASTSSRPSSLHVKQGRTLQEIRDEVERIQKARAAQAASTKPSRRSTKNRTIISNLPEEYSVPITDEAREGKLAARIPGDNASNTSSNEPLTTACESFKSCSSNISQLSTVPFAAMDTAVVSGLRISTTKGIGSDAASNQTAERAKKFLEEEREKERKYQRQKEKRNQKKKPSSSPPTVGEDTDSTEQIHEGSKRQPHTRTGKKGKKKVAPIIWGDDIVKVLQEELHHENEEEDDATAATSTTTDTAGARTKLRPIEEDAAGASKRREDMAAAATACKSVWSIQSDATRVVDNRTTFAQTHFTRTV